MFLSIFFFLALSALASAGGGPLRHVLRERAILRAREKTALHYGALAPPIDEFFFQTLDHYSLSSTASGAGYWKQRFWKNSTFFERGGRTGPVFLYIEGEGTGSPYNAIEGEHVDLAATHNALIVVLEHRFYGASIPTVDLTTESLALLSSHQAIGDIASFLRNHVAPTFNISFPKTKVVTFGGSYPGALSAWARLRLPHLITVGVSTSSPVQASYDFTGYNKVVGQSLARTSIGGSLECLANVRTAFTALDTALEAGGAAAGAAGVALNSCEDLSKADPLTIMWAASNYGGLIQGLVQYNDEGGGLDVRGLCVIMSNAANTPFENLAAAVTAAAGSSCIENSYADYVVSAGNTTANPTARGLGLRQWLYQSCAQFAYWQTCEDRTVCPLSLFMTLSSNVRQCADLYGAPYTAQVSASRVVVTNDLLGGQGIEATKVIYVNGMVDPWHSLSVIESTPEQLAVIILDGAHCSQMGSARAGDSPEVVAARAQIAAQLAIWLQMS
jgi:serine protease 16